MIKSAVFVYSFLFLVACQKNAAAPGAQANGEQKALAVDPVEQLAKEGQTHPLSNEEIQTAIDVEMTTIGACYEQSAEEGGQDTPSTVETEFLVMPSGEPVDIKTWGLSDDINNCVAEAIAKVKFPAFEGDAPMGVQYPFEFAAEATADTSSQ